MPNVISKYLNETAAKYPKVNQELAGKIVGVALLGCTIKLSYPYLKKYFFDSGKSKKTIKIKRCVNNNSGDNVITDSVVVSGSNSGSISSSSSSDDEITKQTNNNYPKSKDKRKKRGNVNLIIKIINFLLPGVNKEFAVDLWMLLKLMVPGILSPEVGLLTVHTSALIARTFMSIYVASMEGTMVKHIVRKDVRNFSIFLLKWLAVAVPATFINSLIRCLEKKISLAFR